MMKKNELKITIVGFIAFTSGMLAQAKLHAKVTNPKSVIFKSQPVVEIPTKFVRYGKASWYSKRSPGINKRTANNEIFDDSGLTCAMWGVPFHQKIKVTNVKNGKSVIVRVNDRGPHQRYLHRGRIVDLTQQAFAQIGHLERGLIDVTIEFLQ